MTTSSVLLFLTLCARQELAPYGPVPTAEQLAGHEATIVDRPPPGFAAASNAMGATDREPRHARDGRWHAVYARTSVHWTPARPKSVETLLDIYYVSVGRGAPLLLEGSGANVGVARHMIDATFRDDGARGATATASSVRRGAFGAANVVDGDARTYWAAADGVTEATLELDLGGAKRFDHVVLREYVTLGQRIERWAVEADGRRIAGGETIGARRIVRVETVTAQRVKLVIEKSGACPAIATFALHLTPRVAREPAIVRSGDTAAITTYGQKVRYTTDGSEPTATSPAYVTPIPVPAGGVVTAAVLQEDNPKVVVLAERLVVRQRFGLPKSGWQVVSFDSQETRGEDGRAANAIDDNPQTFWHTQWADAAPRPPHEIVIDLGAETDVTAIGYLPRQDGGVNGTVEGYEVYVGADGKTWGAAAASGRFDGGDAEQIVKVAARGRFLRLVATSEVNGNAWTSAAEINVYR